MFYSGDVLYYTTGDVSIICTNNFCGMCGSIALSVVCNV